MVFMCIPQCFMSILPINLLPYQPPACRLPPLNCQHTSLPIASHDLELEGIRLQSPKIIMTGLKLIPLTFSFKIDPWGQLRDVLLCIGMLQAYFIVPAGKLAAGHKNKHRNPYCICLVMYFRKHYQSKNILQGVKYWCPLIFFQTKKLLKGSVS
jgi:hypothetical protein